MKISVQTIVFNAENTLPKGMLEKNIEQWFGVADEVIIVEGATRSIRQFDGDTSSFTSDGKSTDNTREIILSLASRHPGVVKVILGDGFWDGKTTMCNAAANAATGDYLWQVDSDEFYHEKDVPRILDLLDKEKPDAVHFAANHFWGGWWTIMDKDQPWGNGMPWMRLFKNAPGSHWASHEPPEYLCANGFPCNMGKVITRDQTDSMGIRMYHYSYVQKSQIDFKAAFYRNGLYPVLWENWQRNNNTRVFGAVTSPFVGEHPACIKDYL